MKRFILILALMLAFSGCSLLDWGAKKGIEAFEKYTTNLDSAAVKTPIDSIVIKFNSVYWKEQIDTTKNECESEFTLDSYKIWQLKTGLILRCRGNAQ